MFLSGHEQTKLLKVVESLHQSLDGQKIREKTGVFILDLLEADFFASFLWNDQQGELEKGVFLNVDAANIVSYYENYYKLDPMRFRLKAGGIATAVSQIMPHDELRGTEFHNNFLFVHGLYYGANLHVQVDEKHIGGIHVWRGKDKPDFDAKSLYLLDLIKPHFRNAMRNARSYELMVAASSNIQIHFLQQDINHLRQQFGLTKREIQVIQEVLKGKKDEEIANHLCIAFSTLRTHLRSIFKKLNANSRSALLSRIYPEELQVQKFCNSF